MRNTLKALLKMPTTKVGIMLAIMFQLIFSVVWMTGYDGVNNNASNVKVAVVNEDPRLGATVAESIGKELPFKVVSAEDLEKASDMLDHREVHMVVHIPGDFTSTVSAPQTKGTLEFYINESIPVTIKNMMTSAANGITSAVNRMAVLNGTHAALTGMKVPGEQASVMAAGLSERVTNQFHYTHPVHSMSQQMVPMMMVLASYVGSMLLALNVEQSSMAIAAAHSKWNLFAARQVINIAAAVVVALVGTTLVTLLGGTAAQGFLALLGFQALFLFAFMTTAQVFVLLFGPAGMLFNIMLLSAQLVSSGAMVPRELLSEFYRGLGDVFPATYAVEGVMNLLFGGPSAYGPSAGLLWIALAALALSAAAVVIRREKRDAAVTETVLQASPSMN